MEVQHPSHGNLRTVFSIELSRCFFFFSFFLQWYCVSVAWLEKNPGSIHKNFSKIIETMCLNEEERNVTFAKSKQMISPFFFFFLNFFCLLFVH